VNKQKFIREFGVIRRYSDYKDYRLKDTFEEIYLSDISFEYLKCFVSENQDEEIEVGKAFSLYRTRGKDYIKVKNLVGVVQLKDKTSIEILPKIYQGDEKNIKENIEETRKTFLKMLKCLKNSPFRSISNAHLMSTKFPILEVFISTFLDELEVLVKRGINKHYITINKNEGCLKGKLLFEQQLKHNLLRPDRFFVKYDEFLENIPQNRIIKAALLILSQQSKSIVNQNRIRLNKFIFEDVESSKNLKSDFLKSDSSNRLFAHYVKTMDWAKVFLQQTSFTNFKGSTINRAILFPMEKIFEDYVTAQIRKHSPEYSIRTQEKLYYLVKKHKSYPKFKLKPDIVLRNNNDLIVIDAKWKIIDENAEKYNYNISQPDMYQLFAYGKKYWQENIQPSLILVYPRHEKFLKSIEVFDFDDTLNLKVIPLNCSTGEFSESIGS